MASGCSAGTPRPRRPPMSAAGSPTTVRETASGPSTPPSCASRMPPRMPSGEDMPRNARIWSGQPLSVPHQAARTEPLTGTWPAAPGAVADLRRHVASFARRAGAPAEAVSSIKLAVSEAATNVVLHAYPNAPGEVRVSVKREGRTLRVDVED